MANGNSAGLVEELRQALSSQLPDYMVPAYFIMLDALPLNANGKLDRKALPAPGDDNTLGAGWEALRVAPRTEAERIIAGIWSDVLGLERVGVTDNFFELGGDSILVIQVISRCRRAGLDLSARDRQIPNEALEARAWQSSN